MSIDATNAASRGDRDGFLAEYEFIREGLRQDQRERLVFLGFALAASGTVLSLLLRANSEHSAGEALFLVEIAAAVTIVAELLTVRATYGVANAGVYLRKFVEPHVTGLSFQGRHQTFLANIHPLVSSSWGLAVAYGSLTVAFIAAWFTIDTRLPASAVQTLVVLLSAAVSGGLTSAVWWVSKNGWRQLERAWAVVETSEGLADTNDRKSG